MGGETFIIMGIDPSGSFKEGAGTTGWCLLKQEGKKITLMETGEISSLHYQTAVAYWAEHLELISRRSEAAWKEHHSFAVSVEAYVLYATKAKAQINSEMETSQLIGAIRMHCFMNDLLLSMRTASQVKDRWADNILIHKGIDIAHLSGHIKDSIRHAMHYAHFRK